MHLKFKSCKKWGVYFFASGGGEGAGLVCGVV